MEEECKPTTDILYHYTSIEAFRKIVESQKIRATRYDQMNDTSEVKLGIDNLLEAVKKHETDDSFRNYLISGIEGYKEGTLEVYVLSLSGAADSLYLWDKYTSSGGVAIGFDFEKLQKGFLCDMTR